MKKIPGQKRQGDVLVQLINEQIPTSAKSVKREKGRIILAHGEATGHAHALSTRNVRLYAAETEERYLQVGASQPAMLKHEEHTHFEIAPGVHRVTRQCEYHPEEIRYVAD
jgi:hypothetical protein